jgi:lysozyme
MTDPPLTTDQIDAMLSKEMERYMGAVIGMVDGATTNQLVALTCCAFNIGIEGMRGSSMIRLHNKGDYAGAARAFSLWIKIRKNGELVDSEGLEARRRREAALYSTPDNFEAEPDPSPQAVAPEETLAKSTITQGGVTVAGIGAVATVATEIAPQLEATKGLLDKAKSIFIDTLGLPLEYWPVLLVAAGGWVVYQRWKRRRDGWI